MILILFVLALFISINGASAASVTPTQVANASGSVKSYVETNHTLPSSVNISGNKVNMSNYLGLETSALLNINKSSNTAVTIKSFGGAPAPSETVTSRTISKSDYLSMASRVRSYMDTNGRAPNYVTQTSTGSTIRYESLVYMFSQILDYYNKNKVLPNSVTVNPWVIVTNPYVINSTSYGYVEKKIYGNKSSTQTIAIIIGVHPQENGIHTAIYNALVSKSSSLAKRYVLYYIHVTQNANDYTQGRMNGQLLAQQFVVPDVPKENPILVIDNHENHGADSGYAYYRFLYPISNTAITTTCANKIINQMKIINPTLPNLVVYTPPNPTSPEYVTVPIADKGITTLIYETYMYDSTATKASYANALITSLDSLPTDTKSPAVAVNPKGNTFNTLQTVALTTTDPDSTTTKTYYTTDGSDPQTSSTRTEYTAPIVLSSDTTLKFSAVDPANHWSPVYTENYVINSTIPIVTADPTGGAFKTSQTVTLTTTCPDSTTTTYYTTDGSDPRTSDTKKQYTESIQIDTTTTLISAAINDLGYWGPLFNKTYMIDASIPKVTADPTGNLYNTSKTVTLTATDADSTTTTYYTTDGSDPRTSSKRVKYTSPITISSTTTLNFYTVDEAGNESPVQTETYTIDKTAPTASADIKGGTYNVNKTINLRTNEVATIYYTTNGTIPTTASTVCKGPIVISSSTVLKFFAVDLAGNKSPVYTETYTIDKTAPQVTSTSPKNGATGFSRTATISIKFSENIKTSTNWTKIYIKNLTTGKLVAITASISGNTLNIKMKYSRIRNNTYQVYIPAAAAKDSANNNLAVSYSFKFKSA